MKKLILVAVSVVTLTVSVQATTKFTCKESVLQEGANGSLVRNYTGKSVTITRNSKRATLNGKVFNIVKKGQYTNNGDFLTFVGKTVNLTYNPKNPSWDHILKVMTHCK